MSLALKEFQEHLSQFVYTVSFHVVSSCLLHLSNIFIHWYILSHEERFFKVQVGERGGVHEKSC